MLSVVHHFVLECSDTSNTNAIYHSDASLVFDIQIKTRIFYSLNSADKCQLGITVNLACFLPIEIFVDIQIFYLACKMGFEFGTIALSNRRCAALSCKQIFPSLLRGIANGCNGTKSCHYNSF